MKDEHSSFLEVYFLKMPLSLAQLTWEWMTVAMNETKVLHSPSNRSNPQMWACEIIIYWPHYLMSNHWIRAQLRGLISNVQLLQGHTTNILHGDLHKADGETLETCQNMEAFLVNQSLSKKLDSQER